MALLDSAELTAQEVARALRAEGLLNPEGRGRTFHLVTGDPEAYRALAERLGERVEAVRRVSLEEL